MSETTQGQVEKLLESVDITCPNEKIPRAKVKWVSNLTGIESLKSWGFSLLEKGRPYAEEAQIVRVPPALPRALLWLC